MLYSLQGKAPEVAADAFVTAESTLIGSVRVGSGSSIWFGAVARADNEPIEIGHGSNVQEGSVLHADPGYPLRVGDGVSIGHQAMLHGCTIGDGCLIGIQAVILNGAVIGEESLVGACALVTEGKTFPPRSLIVGAPAKVLRQLSEDEVANMRANAEDYVRKAQRYRVELAPIANHPAAA